MEISMMRSFGREAQLDAMVSYIPPVTYLSQTCLRCELFSEIRVQPHQLLIKRSSPALEIDSLTWGWKRLAQCRILQITLQITLVRTLFY